MSRMHMYEQERLLLELQELLVAAIKESGLTRREIARRIGIFPSSLTRSLSNGEGLSLARAADIALAAGYRIVPKLTRILETKTRRAQ